MADGKIVYDADFGAVNTKADQTRKKVEGIGEAANKTGQAFSMWGRQMGGLVAKMTGILTVINAIGEASSENRERRVAANAATGSAALSRDLSARSLGITSNAATAAVTGPGGSASVEEMDTFLGSMASAAKSGKVPFRRNVVMAALSARSSGVFTDQELIDRLQKRQPMPGAAEVMKRREGMSEASLGELDQRARERRNVNTAQTLEAQRGSVSREAQSVMDRRRAESPLSWEISDIGAKVPGLRTLIEADRQFAAESEVRRNLKAIAESNAKMAVPRLVIPSDPGNAPR
jgi:hypothetical protein